MFAPGQILQTDFGNHFDSPRKRMIGQVKQGILVSQRQGLVHGSNLSNCTFLLSSVSSPPKSNSDAPLHGRPQTFGTLDELGKAVNSSFRL